MLALLVILAQTPAPAVIQDPNTTTKAKVVTTSGGALQVSCVGGTCSGGGGGTAQWTTVDGGHVAIWDGTDVAQVTTGRLLVDGSGVTQPISGTVAATQSGAWSVTLGAGTANVGDIDVLTVPAPLSTTGGGGEATALRVTVANDSTGVLSVDDNGSSLTVDGTVTVGTFPDNEPFNVAQWGGSATTLGQKAMAASVPVVIASDQSAITVGTHAVTQSGTWTVQPGNTANTTPWLTTDTPRQVASANNSGTCVSVTASTTVLASNASRRAYGFKASEANTDRVHCKLGATATTSNTIFGPGASWSQDTGAVYTGVIDCIAASGTQSVCPYEVN